MKLVQTIDDVINNLDNIITQAKANRSRNGYFAAMYRQVNLKIQQGINEGFFDDGVRMEEFDLRLANRYFSSLEAYQKGGKLTESWKIAFEATEKPQLIIIQHLLLAINAHFNLDLGIVTAQTAPGDELSSLAGDFAKINLILSNLLDPIQGIIDQLSPLMDVLDRVGGRTDEVIVNFSINKARSQAWKNAQLLAYQTPEQQAETIAMLDRQAAFLGGLIADPGRLLGKAIELVQWSEQDDIVAIIDALYNIN